MKKTISTVSALALTASLLVAADKEPRLLLDEKLSAWESFIGIPHETVVIPGMPASTSKDGTNGTPLGLGNDPLNVFSIIKENGKPVLRVSGQIYGGLTTLEEFENYHFSCQFKWGEKKWAPRLDKKRDSGLLYHCYREHGAFWKVWMRSVEFQVQEGDCGDFFGLGGTTVTLLTKIDPEGKNASFKPDGKPYTFSGYAKRLPCIEKPNGEWNTLEIYTLGDTAVHVVNGVPIMVLFDICQKLPDGKSLAPLKRGKIQIQSEGAEAFYRDIQIETISAFPDFLTGLTQKPTTPAEPYPPKDK